MSYTSQSEVEIAAGGPRALLDLSDYNQDGFADSDVIEQAQREVDAWIDGFARRLYDVPFAPVPDAIRALAAAETVYRLKQYLRVTDDQDRALRREREETMRALEAGKWNPVEMDPYPIGDGGGTPIAALRTGAPSSCDGCMSRWELIGYW